MPTLARLVGLFWLARYYIVHVEAAGFYDTMAGAFQLTLFSMHAAPIIAMRLALATIFQPWFQALLAPTVGASWIVFSLHCRKWKMDPWSCSFIACETIALFATLTESRLGGLLFLQPIIIVGFWIGMAVASMSPTFSFLPLDRHLHRGWRHMLASRDAQARLLHDIGGHGLQQILFAWSLSVDAGVAAQLTGALWLFVTYAGVVFLTASMVPPHVLPYMKVSLWPTEQKSESCANMHLPSVEHGTCSSPAGRDAPKARSLTRRDPRRSRSPSRRARQ